MSLLICVAQRMQHSNRQQQEKQKALQEELQTLRQKTEKEKEEQGRQDQEALALLTQKAERAEESARQLSLKLQEKVGIQMNCGALKYDLILKYFSDGGKKSR